MKDAITNIEVLRSTAVSVCLQWRYLVRFD